MAESRCRSLKLRLNNNQLPNKYLVLPTILQCLGHTLSHLEIAFDGGITRSILETPFPQTKIDSLHLHDHYLPPTDDPRIRPRIFELGLKIIEPNKYSLRCLKIDYYRSSIEGLVCFLERLDKATLKTLHLVVSGNFEESD